MLQPENVRQSGHVANTAP